MTNHLPSGHEVMRRLADESGLRVEALQRLGVTWNDGAWEWPELNAEGEVIGTARRFDDGSKGFVKGGKRGLTMARPLGSYEGSSRLEPIFVVEGMTDCAAGLGLGFVTVGRPSATGGLEHLRPLLRDRHVVVVGENDDSAGRDGAEKIAGGLLGVAQSVRVLFPPEGTKDLRAWVQGPSPLTREELLSHIKSAKPAEIRAAPIEGERARIELRPIPASELGSGESVDWIWFGYLAKGFITQLVGLWKAGKTTLLAHLLHAAEGGGAIGGEVFPCKVLVVTEEGGALWARRRDDIGIADNAHFAVRPFMGRPTRGEWEAYVRCITQKVKEKYYEVVVFDTWQTISPSDDENDAAKTIAALTPLYAILEAGAAILLMHHPKKGDAGEGQASRGSGAMTGFVDIIVELRRYEAEQADDRRRVLRTYSRFDETPREVVIELREDGYHSVGSKAEAKQEDRMEVIDDVLASAERALTPQEVLEGWPDGGIPTPSKRTVQSDLAHGARTDRWRRTGAGRKGDPYRYEFDSRTLPPLSARIESDPPDEDGDWVEVA